MIMNSDVSTPRSNLLGLYRRQGFRHAPVALNLCPALQETYRQMAGDTPLAEFFDYPEGFASRVVPGLEAEPAWRAEDWAAYYRSPLAEGTTFSPYGVAHEPGGAAAMHMTRMRHPLESLSSLEQLKSYPFPVYNAAETDAISRAVASVHADGLAAVGNLQRTIWETAWGVRSMPGLMLDMAMEDNKAVYLLDRVTDNACKRAAAFARGGVDVILLGDDIGMQDAPMMSTDMYDTWLKPRLAKVIEAARAEKPDVLVFYHSCGFIKPFIESLIDAGVDILNPVQPECMDFAEIQGEYGDRLSFHGTIGTQTTMPFGSPEDVRQVVLRNLELAGRQGGLLCCPTHLLEPEVPWANIEAYVRACKEFSVAGV
jgi:hypothetical protein